GMPESADNPAPVSTSTRRAAASVRAAMAISTAVVSLKPPAYALPVMASTRSCSYLEHGFAVIRQLGDGIANIVHSQMGGILFHAIGNIRCPAFGQFLERADVNMAIMEIGFQLRHVVVQEAAILADA